jgi:hypothetical protein
MDVMSLVTVATVQVQMGPMAAASKAASECATSALLSALPGAAELSLGSGYFSLCSTTGVGGTGKMISDATFQSFATLSQLMIMRKGLGVPSCPA